MRAQYSSSVVAPQCRINSSEFDLKYGVPFQHGVVLFCHVAKVHKCVFTLKENYNYGRLAFLLVCSEEPYEWRDRATNEGGNVTLQFDALKELT